uniref:Molybdopterin synthase catalytic subunit n=2 Tax=Hirondellea gigas TaxID=1518452 RepID=A0A2P2IBU8_9CRUS
MRLLSFHQLVEGNSIFFTLNSKTTFIFIYLPTISTQIQCYSNLLTEIAAIMADKNNTIAQSSCNVTGVIENHEQNTHLVGPDEVTDSITKALNNSVPQANQTENSDHSSPKNTHENVLPDISNNSTNSNTIPNLTLEKAPVSVGFGSSTSSTASGITHVELTYEELSVSDITSMVSNPGCGAISLFVGTTRDVFDDKQVVSLEYEAYHGMAEKEMKKLCDEARARWTLQNIAVVHRLGSVGVLEASIIVAVSSVHRAEAISATAFIMDRIKARIPVWKKEVYSDGSKSWKENKECSWKTKRS